MKNILITGASSGIGLACAKILDSEDNKLFLCSRNLEKLKMAVKDLNKSKVVCFKLDVSNREEVEKTIENLEINKLDILINNAGFALGRDLFDDAYIEDWEKMIDTNLKGIMYVTKKVLPYLKKSNSSHIINLGSIAGINVYQKGNMYCATKSAVASLSQSMRIDLLKHKIKVTLILPGAVETEFSIVRLKGDLEEVRKIYDGLEALTGEDVANAIKYCIFTPPHVCINELTITPLRQANAYYSFKD